jgi:hypothetical protein
MWLEPRQDQLYWATRDADSVTHAPATGPRPSVPTLAPEIAAPTSARLRALGAADGWHEYGAYVTLMGFGLAVLGLAVSWRRCWPLYAAGALAGLVVLSTTVPVDLWGLLQQLPLYASLTVPSRFLAAVVLTLAVAAAFGLDWLYRFASRHRRPLLTGLTGYAVPIVIYAELAWLGWTLWGDIFVYRPVPLAHHERFATRYDRLGPYSPGMYSYTYPALVANSGVLEGYENIQVPQGAVLTEGDPRYRGEAYLLSGGSPVTIRDWRMAAVQVDVTVRAPDTLLLNQNFFPGWRARIVGSGGVREQRAEASASGIVAVAVYEGDQAVRVYYAPPGFTGGAAVSAIAWVMCVAFLVRRAGWQGPAKMAVTPAAPAAI